jgi:dipeptidyl aminopeptidase/acylaminoacyl peptidase
MVASIPAPLSGLKAAVTPNGNINFLMNGQKYPNGTAYNELLAKAPLSTARLYDSIYVRHWDRWLTPETFTLFAGTLTPSSDSSNSSSAWNFSGDLRDLLAGIEGSPETPVQPFGDSGDYDITSDGSTVAFLTKAPELPYANFTASYIYLVPHDGSSTAVPFNCHSCSATPANARGASAAPRFSPEGSSIAYFQMDGESYESDKNKIYIASLGDSATITELAENWDRSPGQLRWAPDGLSLVVSAADVGHERLFSMPIDASADYVPTNYSDPGTVATFYILPDSSALVSASSIWSSRDFYIATPESSTWLFTANSTDPGLSGLGPEDVSDFWYSGNFTTVHGWIVYPENFTNTSTYPLAFLIHGGPQSAWLNSWSTRWNPKVWADQGYVVIAINPTGSLSYGQAFTDAIQNNWGSYPYDDLVKGWEYVKSSGLFPYIDTTHGIAAGASYGGYMVNWIQGQPLGREFKALVTHDGSTSTLNQYASEELWFMQHDFNGTLWDNRDNYERWDPIAHAKDFATPHFVVHSSKDYRLPVSEGVMLFNVLQERGVDSRFLNFPDENHWLVSFHPFILLFFSPDSGENGTKQNMYMDILTTGLCLSRVLKRENSRVWHSEIFKFINRYSGVSA